MKIYVLTSGIHLDEEWQETNYLSERGRTNFLMWIINDRVDSLRSGCGINDCEIVVTNGICEDHFPITINGYDFLKEMEKWKNATIMLKSYGDDWETYYLEEMELDDWDA